VNWLDKVIVVAAVLLAFTLAFLCGMSIGPESVRIETVRHYECLTPERCDRLCASRSASAHAIYWKCYGNVEDCMNNHLVDGGFQLKDGEVCRWFSSTPVEGSAP